MLACCLFIVGVYVYLDFSNMSALVGFASGHPSPFWRIARGQLVLPAGMIVSWVACMAIERTDPSLFAYVPYLALGLLLALALLAAFVPFKDNTFADELNISAYTAKTHVYHIYQKMGINSQQELISIVDSTEVVYQ
ncbi:hypothetical protein GKE55_03355 [Gordonibacter pamelaeae]|nr:hypothetical protein [Gordonibacter pamelaeae]